MIKRQGKYTIKLENEPRILGYASAAGKKESEGPLGDKIDKIYLTADADQENYEKGESELLKTAVFLACEKSGVNIRNIDIAFAGDLLNQCTASGYAFRAIEIPYLGQYGACSTMAQSLLLSAIAVESNCAEYALCATSSHFCSAERQYRFPITYGGQRTPNAQWTVTGAGSCVLGKSKDNKPRVTALTIGKIVDLGVTDAANMGAAMAPAAADTLKKFLKDTNTLPSDYDMIFTGDLGSIGSKLLKELLEKDNISLQNHNDCGLLIYDIEKQDMHAGGSGCGCCATVLCSEILSQMERGKLNNILVIATGALMSPTKIQQGESIPSIAHLVHIVAN